MATRTIIGSPGGVCRTPDCDDLACFVVTPDDVATKIAVVHGWMTPEGYSIDHVFDDFWEWLKFVIDEMRDWAITEWPIDWP